VQTIRPWWLLVAFLSGAALAMFAEELILSYHDNRLEFSPKVDFLTGPALAHLRNAATVPIDINISVFSGAKNHLYGRSTDRFIVSFDLWEESFSVVKTQAPRRTASHLSARAAEAWCFNQMSIETAGLAPTEQLWAHVDVRAEEPAKDGRLFGRGNVSESGINLTSLIEIFSRPAQSQQQHWTLDAGPFTLNQIRRSGS
jgi:hypothetical protein